VARRSTYALIPVCACLQMIGVRSARAGAEVALADPGVKLVTLCSPLFYSRRSERERWLTDTCGGSYRTLDGGASWAPTVALFPDKVRGLSRGASWAQSVDLRPSR